MTVLDFQGLLDNELKIEFYEEIMNTHGYKELQEIIPATRVCDVDFASILDAEISRIIPVNDMVSMNPKLRLIIKNRVMPNAVYREPVDLDMSEVPLQTLMRQFIDSHRDNRDPLGVLRGRPIEVNVDAYSVDHSDLLASNPMDPSDLINSIIDSEEDS